jgi:hypothetical protein
VLVVDLWQSREQALAALAADDTGIVELLDSAFDMLDDCALEIARVDSPHARVAALIIVKCRSLALGFYSLTLDGLAPESGALLRPLTEYFELLQYLREDPARVTKMLDHGVPRAGVVAKAVSGEFQRVRTYLSSTASHASVGPGSTSHLVDTDSGLEGWPLHLQQPFRPTVVRDNLETLLSMLVIVAIESVLTAGALECAGEPDLMRKLEAIELREAQVLGTE